MSATQTDAHPGAHHAAAHHGGGHAHKPNHPYHLVDPSPWPLTGSIGAIALTWGVSRYALDIPWRIFPRENVAGVVLTAILVAVIGVLSSLDVLRNKPLATLRAE